MSEWLKYQCVVGGAQRATRPPTEVVGKGGGMRDRGVSVTKNLKYILLLPLVLLCSCEPTATKPERRFSVYRNGEFVCVVTGKLATPFTDNSCVVYQGHDRVAFFPEGHYDFVAEVSND